MRRKFSKLIASMLVLIMIVMALPMSISAEPISCKNGDLIKLGSYPQSKVKDDTLIEQLEAQELNWVSYNYYSGENGMGSMKPGDWMQYADVEFDGEKYRCVTFSQYRPVTTYDISNEKNSNQDDNGYKINTHYWFKFEPITWKVIDVDNGIVMSSYVLDSQPFNNNYYLDGSINNDSENPQYANYYVTCSLRTWLHEDFYNLSFDESEREQLLTATLDNKAYPGLSKFDQEETQEKVFLLSYYDVTEFANNAVRQARATDYARCQGATSGYSRWSLRSAGLNANYSCQVARDGKAGRYGLVSNSDGGVRPALKLDLVKNHDHKYVETRTEPSCYYDGRIIKSCECGDVRLVEILPATGHIWDDGVVITGATCVKNGVKKLTCTGGCGETKTETIPATGHNDADDNGICDACGEVLDATKTCTHICHKGGISAFFYKIARFFWKLFKTNKYCSCGAAHY
ncbi:MAG: DUF6273 domain-containing protein [Ruminococcus sp.]|nr:DUF6273 domain-containing protein [Ruminococcus sp.]